ncbi:DUF7269 family protein [Halomicrococcus sp. NG-SE-24]|uniref:DUF7269 family protein n=1 Tax=Halomicrococcus sp. NG-SE-24 TaxID=3436928 RepID=UPI003D96B215
MSDRPLLTAAGVLAAAWGIAALFAPQLAAVVSTDYLFVRLVGVLALLQGVRVVQERRRGSIDQAETGDPETTVSVPTPGGEFDESLRRVHDGARKSRFKSRKRIRKRLESAVVDAIVQREGCSSDEAREVVKSGEWTDDPYAASFVGGPDPPRRPLRKLFRRSVDGETKYQRRARRTADAVARYVEEGR